MKKLAALLLIFALCTALGACEKEKEASDKKKGSSIFDVFQTTQVTATPLPTPEITQEPTQEPTEEPTEAPTEEPTEEPGEDVTLSNDDFSITVPAGWLYDTAVAAEGEVFLIIQHPESTSNINMIWTSDTTLELESFGDEEALALADMVIQSSGIPLTYAGYDFDGFGNKDGAVLYYTFAYNGVDGVMIQALIPVDDGTYVLTLTLVDLFDANAMMEVVETLEFN